MLYSYRQMRRDYKIKLTDKSKANLWIHLDLAKVHRLKGLTSPYIISYLHFLNLNNILALPKPSSSLKLGLVWHELCSPCFFPARFTRMRATLRNQNKCKPCKSQLNQRRFSHLFEMREHFTCHIWYVIAYFLSSFLSSFFNTIKIYWKIIEYNRLWTYKIF